MLLAPVIKFLVLGMTAIWVLLPLTGRVSSGYEINGDQLAQCPSGHADARLTGWPLNSKTPRGTATYDETAQRLDVAVESVDLPDGRVLWLFIGDDRIGELQPLKDGAASGRVTRQIPDKARVRVFDGERPIVSANLQCSDSKPAPTPTATRSPTPSPSPSAPPVPSPSVSPTSTPSPPTEPTPDPMPTKTPVPTPSPHV